MTLRIGETAPDFEADTTEGRIRFHDWIGNLWAVLFSHPKDFTPVCTTELGTMARLKPEFDKRNVKIIGLSVDPVDSHSKWANDIKETQGYAPNYPLIGDPELKVSKLYSMLPAEAGSSSQGRTAADNTSLYVVNNGGVFLGLPGGPEDASIVRLDVGLSGVVPEQQVVPEPSTVLRTTWTAMSHASPSHPIRCR